MLYLLIGFLVMTLYSAANDLDVPFSESNTEEQSSKQLIISAFWIFVSIYYIINAVYWYFKHLYLSFKYLIQNKL